MKRGYRFEDFSVKSGKEWCLKNHSGRCIFLSEDGCKIYSVRPEGCRLYPLMYDENIQKAVMDKICPYGNEFKVLSDDFKKLRALLKKLRVQRTSQ